MKQPSFASLNFATKKKQTRREVFLGEMEQVVPWAKLEALIAPSYPTEGRRGRPPMRLSKMLRIHFMQQWYVLSDPGMEDALYEIESMRGFAGVELNEDVAANRHNDDGLCSCRVESVLIRPSLDPCAPSRASAKRSNVRWRIVSRPVRISD